MAVFRPKRQWKPKRRDRNIARRKKRKRWWRRNRNRIKMQRRRRYRRLRNNSLFKQWRKKRQREKAKRRMRFAAETALPESWFIFYDEQGPGQPLDIDLGYILDYDPDTEELLIHDVDEESEKVVDLVQFLRHSEFLEEADLDNFDLLMDQYYGESADDLDIVPDSEVAPPDLAAIQEGRQIVTDLIGEAEWFRGVGIGPAPEGDGLAVTVRVAPGYGDKVTELISDVEDFPADFEVVEVEMPEARSLVVAGEWLRRKVAFNKENPTDLLNQLVKVLEKAKGRAGGRGEKRLGDVASRVRGIGRDVQDAWRRRREE